MPIYSNLYSNLARQGFAKTFSHDYAQSVVAATHPSTYPNQHNRTGFGRRHHHRGGKLVGYTGFKNAFHTSSSLGAASATVVQHDVRPPQHIPHDAGLAAYFDAWEKQHPAGEPEKEWTQFQFAKCIEWEPAGPEVPVAQAQAQAQAVEAAEAEDDVFITARPALERSHSTSAVDVLRKAAETAAVEVEEEGRVTPELAQQIRDIHINGLDQVISAGVRTPPLSLEEFRKSPLSVSSAEKCRSSVPELCRAPHEAFHERALCRDPGCVRGYARWWHQASC